MKAYPDFLSTEPTENKHTEDTEECRLRVAWNGHAQNPQRNVLNFIRHGASAIDVRKVLGASVNQITFMMSAEFVKLVIVALIVATPFTWFNSTSIVVSIGI